MYWLLIIALAAWLGIQSLVLIGPIHAFGAVAAVLAAAATVEGLEG